MFFFVFVFAKEQKCCPTYEDKRTTNKQRSHVLCAYYHNHLTDMILLSLLLSANLCLGNQGDEVKLPTRHGQYIYPS